MIVGTVAYMSPEQARGKTVDARTDIFSLGVTLYEMIERRHPFLGETISHTMVAIMEKEPPPLEGAVKDAPAKLGQIINRALAKNADERYQSAPTLLADLKRLQKRLEFAVELARDSSAPRGDEAQTQIFRDGSRELAGEPAAISAPTPAARPKRSARFWL